MNTAQTARPSFFRSFSRAQISSAAATAVDWALLAFLTEAFAVWYVLSTALGAFAGGVTNFLINRHWSFEATRGHMPKQVRRYIVISGLSMILNTLGVWALTEATGIHYGISVVAVSLLIGFLFNYPLHRYWVFR